MRKIMLYVAIILFAVIAVSIALGNIFEAKKQKNNYIAKVTLNTSKTGNAVNNTEDESILTSFFDEKISAKTIIIEEIYYDECKHQIDYTLKNIDKYVNMTKEEFKKEFPKWEIIKFSKEKVILYKEENGFCNEHFLVKDEDGYVSIYTIDNEEKILELLDKTDIATKYLTQVDQGNLKKGIIVYTKQNLNKLIEDFE